MLRLGVNSARRNCCVPYAKRNITRALTLSEVLDKSVSGKEGTQEREHRQQVIRDLSSQFQTAARRNDPDKAVVLLTRYQKAEGAGAARLWMFNELLHMFARRREPDRAFEVAKQIKAAKLRPDAFTYGGLLNACAKAAHPPYDLPKEYAEKAQAVFARMLQSGIEPNRVHFHSLMDCQAKAGLVKDAFATFETMKATEIKLDGYTLNILVNACAKAGQPLLALDTVERLTKLPGVKATTVTWNTVLGAFARAEDMDGAYAVWQCMQAAKVLPDHITQRVLSQAFAGNATLAAELVSEAQRNRSQILADLPIKVSPQEDGRLLRAHRQKPQIWLDKLSEQGHVADAFQLDLHGMSVPAARMALLRRLDYLVSNHITHTIHGKGQTKEGVAAAAAADPPAADGVHSQRANGETGSDKSPALRDLHVVVGMGSHSQGGKESLPQVALELLRSKGLKPHIDGGNAGVIIVPVDDLSAFLDQQRNVEMRGRFLHTASMQSVLVAAGLSSVAAAVFIVPRILGQYS